MIPDNKETTYLIGEKYMSPDNYITGGQRAAPIRATCSARCRATTSA